MVGAAGRGCVADLIIINARVHTVDPSMPSAQAVAVCGDRLGRVGSNEDVRATADAKTRVIDAGGRLLVPGFNDAHVHLISGADELVGINLRPATSEQDFARRLGDYAARQPKGAGSLAASGITKPGRARRCLSTRSSTPLPPTTLSSFSGSTDTWGSRTRSPCGSPVSVPARGRLKAARSFGTRQASRRASSRTTRWI